MDCRDAYRFVRCGFVYVNVCYGAAFMYAAAHPCCRALVMLPRTRMLPLIRGAVFVYAAARLCSRASVVPRTFILPRTCMPPRVRPNGLKFSVLPRPMLPRSSTCCRVPCLRAVLCVSASHGAAQYSVCRVPCCRAVLCVAASHGAAQFYMLPRSMLPRSSLCFRVPWCRAALRAAALHGAARGTTLRVFALLPRGGLDC